MGGALGGWAWHRQRGLDYFNTHVELLHDSFELPDSEHIIHELLRELPTAFLVFVLAFGFILPYDVMGRRNGKLMEYRRYEACTRFFETRCVLELMRALSVLVTTQGRILMGYIA